jgi:membrane-associated phospholipid phosphatase
VFMHTIGNLGHSAILLPASAILLALLGWAGRRRDILAYASALAICLVATLVGKLVFHACGPSVGFDFASPSGHTSLSATFYGCLALIVAGGRPAWQRAALYLATAVFVVLIGLSRVVVEAHTLSDVVLGISVGIISVMTFVLLRGPARPVHLPIRIVALALPVGAAAIWLILGAARHWTPEHAIAVTGRALERTLDVCG